tara:strand:- start:245 stop:361 length:117 start_codon:yes stop_codon:yes gene_type:complete
LAVEAVEAEVTFLLVGLHIIIEVEEAEVLEVYNKLPVL